MANPTSPVNTNNRDLDLLVLAAGTDGYLKLALAGSNITPTGSSYGAAVQVVALHSPTTATLSNVSGSATSVTLLSANAARRGAAIYNDSSAVLYVKFGTTASSSSFTVKMQPDEYYEVPGVYAGRIDGIWASATGAARVTELTI